MNAIKSIAAGACIECRTAVFSVNPYGGHGNLKRQPGKPRRLGCDSISLGASNTTEYAGSPPDSGIFSRPEFTGVHFCTSHGFGRDGLVRKAGRMAYSMFETSRPPDARSNASGGLQSQYGVQTMTNVIPLARARAAKTAQSTTSSPDIPRQQAAIENALSMALYYMRQPRTDSALHAATAKTNRALTLLKTACTDTNQNGGAA